MVIAAKHLDPLVGLDTHIILIPSPAGPIPTPLPHPYVGMVLDPFDYVPFLGATTYINGLPRAQAGTSGIALPPHIPMGGPFAKPPTNESEIFMGSATVLVEGEPQSFLSLPVLSCQDIGIPPPPRPKKKSVTKSLVLPTTVVLSIPLGMLVLIGGPPTISLTAMAFRAGMGALKKLRKSKLMRKVSDKIHNVAEKAIRKRGLSKAARNRVHKTICAVTGHPVDVATGKVFTDRVDFELPGPIPLQFERTWFSTSTYRGPLGYGWHHRYDQALYLEEDVILYQTADGRHIGLPRLKQGAEYFDWREQFTFFCDASGYGIRNSSGLVHRFVRIRGRPDTNVPLVEIRNGVGHRVELRYDDRGRLAQIIDCAGRSVEVTSDQRGRIVALSAPHPEIPEQRVCVARYAYDGRGNLVKVWDALGQPATFQYQHHLLTQETDRNGLSFYFAYDGSDADARCIRTWGDGGIYDHKLSYDLDSNVTVVEDSLGHKTTYFHDGAMVTKTIDALGNTTETEYDDAHRVVTETDALGGKTRYAYDDRGNLSESVGPDGATVKLTHGPDDLPIHAIDPVGGEWTWKREPSGRLLEARDPLGRVTQYHYQGPRLVGITDPAGGTTSVGYDQAGNLEFVAMPDGAVTRYQHDLRGRIIGVTDPKGNLQRRQLDALDRIERLDEPDGNVRTLAYDPEGNITHARDQHHDVEFTYQGMGRLASRRQADTTIHFEYDTEERLTGIANEHGCVYRFHLGSTGEVDEEIGFDGLIRRYTRDQAGRVQRIERAADSKGERFSEYAYDAGGRVTEVSHSDGRVEQYSYRPDGELTAAVASEISVTFERDALGRVVKEVQGRHWVESEYDALGLRVRMRSSLGTDQVIERNVMGDVVRVADQNTQYETRFARDPLGLELERSLPGGLRSKWQRDKVGRPIQHSVESKTKCLRAVSYQWEPNDRLKMVINALSGATQYSHDAFGNLAWAKYSDGTVDLRMPDAIGNLFKTEQRTDRQYGPAGQLLAAETPQGWIRYQYDPEGNLVEKLEPNGRLWRYEWNGTGMLVKVVRPDDSEVTFEYDAIGRRVAKTYRGQTTRWVWDGNKPLHEWVEGPLEALVEPEVAPLWRADAQVKKREAELQQHLSQGPPLRGTKDAPLTWLFEPESLAPIAKLVGGEQYSIVTDYLGTPVLMTDAKGKAVWSAGMSAYGELRDLEGERGACPFRWPGQYEDTETGLYYNRFRYYDPEAGGYVSQDPIRLAGGAKLYGYVHDTTTWTDPLGLKACGPKVIVVGEGMDRVKKAVRDLRKKGVDARWYQAWGKNFPAGRPMTPAEMNAALRRNKRWLKSKIKQGYGVFDIGVDPGRSNRSPFYAMEKQVLSDASYPTTFLTGY
jgi:RHS repeat-associated protein